MQMEHASYVQMVAHNVPVPLNVKLMKEDLLCLVTKLSVADKGVINVIVIIHKFA